MKVGRGVAYKKTDAVNGSISFVIGCVKKINPDSLIAVEPNGTETELFKGEAHRVNSEKLEGLLRNAVGIELDLPVKKYDEEDFAEDGDDEDYVDLDEDEPEDEGEED